ncbi:hypothetical protein PR048_015258 [Dryococelus australis]|uniref:Uncharacterized protein n=1 Tax=Dryococelus australis TaxID=614101 RepID=A0ABQ9HGL2_9NEOP|nr:hypothetical protein PR048_015258 [Dryococelus australis]
MQAYFAALLQITVEKRDRTAVQMVPQRESEERHDKRQLVCLWKYSTACCNLLKQLLYKLNILTPAVLYGIFVDMERCCLGARPGCLVREESALVEVKFVPSAKPLGLMETARQKRNFFLERMSDNILKHAKMHYYVLLSSARSTEQLGANSSILW